MGMRLRLKKRLGLLVNPSSEPNNGFLRGQAQNGMLQPGQIHG